MQAGLAAFIALEEWENAARAAGNLSELHLTLGAVERAVATARQAVALADHSGDAFRRMVNRTTLADALHQAGESAEAETLFAAAEAMQAERAPEDRWLYTLRGFQYCDLLLGRGKGAEVKARAAQTFDIAQRNNWLLSIALDHLSLGRALLLEAAEGSGDVSEAEAQLDRAVAALRQAGAQEFIPHGLLARAALHRRRRHFAAARRDLDEVLALARRSGMALHETDAHLEFARLYLADDDPAAARQHFEIARAAVARLGYHRRDPEVAELQRQLG